MLACLSNNWCLFLSCLVTPTLAWCHLQCAILDSYYSLWVHHFTNTDETGWIGLRLSYNSYTNNQLKKTIILICTPTGFLSKFLIMWFLLTIQSNANFELYANICFEGFGFRFWRFVELLSKKIKNKKRKQTFWLERRSSNMQQGRKDFFCIILLFFSSPKIMKLEPFVLSPKCSKIVTRTCQSLDCYPFIRTCVCVIKITDIELIQNHLCELDSVVNNFSILRAILRIIKFKQQLIIRISK